VTETRTAVAAPEPGLREHCRQFHSRITLRGQSDVKVARAHSSDHYHFGSTTHHHGPNPGPHARPEGWRTGGGVVLTGRHRAGGGMPRPVPRPVSGYEAQQAEAARKRRRFQPAAQDLAECLAETEAGGRGTDSDRMAAVEQWIREMGGYEQGS
jgi:hypothetical protein